MSDEYTITKGTALFILCYPRNGGSNEVSLTNGRKIACHRQCDMEFSRVEREDIYILGTFRAYRPLENWFYLIPEFTEGAITHVSAVDSSFMPDEEQQELWEKEAEALISRLSAKRQKQILKITEKTASDI